MNGRRADTDLVVWALSVRGIPNHPKIGVSRVRLVLVALCTFANRLDQAYPGRAALAEACPDLTPRDAQRALDLLADAGFIKAVNGRRRGRTIVWQIERDRQLTELGWTAEHDDSHGVEHLVQLHDRAVNNAGMAPSPIEARDELVKAAALLVAAIEVLDRRRPWPAP